MTLLTVLLVFIIQLCQADNLDEFKKGYCAGRSGAVVIDSDKYSKITFQSSFVVDATNQVTDDIQLFNVISKHLNLPRIFTEGDAPEVEVDIFSTPKGNIFLSFDGVSTGDLNKLNLKVIGQDGISISRTSRPYNPLSTLATIITGTQPRNHGIIRGREQLKESSFLSSASGIYKDSKVISGSYFHDVSKILETNRDGSYYWDNVKHQFKQSADEHFVRESKISNDVFAKTDFSFLERFGGKDLVESWATDILKTELLFVWNSINYLKEETKSPNFLNFHFQSLSLIANEFGENSNEYTTAISLVDKFLNEILSDIDYAYELLFLPNVHHEDSKSHIELIKQEFPELNLKNYPQIYLNHALNNDGNKKSVICNTIRKLVQDPSTQVFCLFSHAEVVGRRQKRANFEEAENFEVEAAEPTTEEFFGPVVQLHLYLWIFLSLTIFLLYTVYLLVGIETDQGLSATSSYVQRNPRK